MTVWTDDILMDFVLGELPGALARALGESLAEDDALASRVNDMRELFGALPLVESDGGTPDPSVDLFHRIEAAVESTNRFADFAPQVMQMLGCTRREAMRWLDGIDDPSNFGPGVLPGTVMWPVPTDDDKGIVWLKMPPGMEFPHHAHIGDEEVLVLQGRYIDHLGRIHLPGTILREESDSEHSFRIDADGPEFVCLAVVGHGIRVGDDEISREHLYGV